MTDWRVNEGDGHVYQHDGPDRWPPPRRLATVYSPNRRERAHLIAAAPDLLEALERLLGLTQLLAGRDDLPQVVQSILSGNHWRITDARAAIAKAKGESQ